MEQCIAAQRSDSQSNQTLKYVFVGRSFEQRNDNDAEDRSQTDHYDSPNAVTIFWRTIKSLLVQWLHRLCKNELIVMVYT